MSDKQPTKPTAGDIITVPSWFPSPLAGKQMRIGRAFGPGDIYKRGDLFWGSDQGFVRMRNGSGMYEDLPHRYLEEIGEETAQEE